MHKLSELQKELCATQGIREANSAKSRAESYSSGGGGFSSGGGGGGSFGGGGGGGGFRWYNYLMWKKVKYDT